jgi:hypothetical protein
MDYHEAIVLPNIVRSITSEALKSRKNRDGGQAFTIFRQFVEYPPINEEKRLQFAEIKYGDND